MPSSRGLPNPGIKPESLMSPALTDGFLTTSAIWEALIYTYLSLKNGVRGRLILCPETSPHPTKNSTV